MKIPKTILTPITVDDMKDAVKFTIHYSDYSGQRNPRNKKRWLIRSDFLDRVVYDFEDGEGVVYFINDECKGKQQRVTIEYSNKLKGFKTDVCGKKSHPKTKFVCPEKMF